MMKAHVDEDTCIGCGACAGTCPDIFELDGDVSTVKVDEIPEAQKQCAEAAAENCPVGAITLD